MKNLFSFVFFIGSARPPEMIQSSSVGPCAAKNISSKQTLCWLGMSAVRQGKVDLKRWKIGC
ncbi:hypothetical protein N9M62_02125 [Candidatus Poseidoniales archaeon]|nr:hypothetical protein [Candidatus Poseidoniales archaeon]